MTGVQTCALPIFYYNGLPARSTISCGIDDIKALPALDERELTDPWIEAGGRRFAWKGKLGAGQYLVFWPGEPARRHAPQLLEPELAEIVQSAELIAGEHAVRFGAAGGLPMHVRVRVTIQPPERHPVQ